VGLRPCHYPHIVENWPDQVDWFEIISENYMVDGGKPLHFLDRIRSRYPMVMHGVSMSIGSTDPLDMGYLARLKQLAEHVQPAWVSDHLCWSSTGKHSVHDLLPLPYTRETISHVVDRVKRVQEFLGRRILLENVSSYMAFKHSEMPEWEFLTEIAERADCMILLDVNNIYVSSFNHKFDPMTYINWVPKNRVGQFHLAGHSDHGTYLLDTHDHHVKDKVWELYVEALKRFGPISTLIEWDDHIPEFEDLMKEVARAKTQYQHYVDQTQSNADRDAGHTVAAHHST